MWKFCRIPVECGCTPGPQTVIGWEAVDVSIASSTIVAPVSDEPLPKVKPRSGGLKTTKYITKLYLAMSTQNQNYGPSLLYLSVHSKCAQEGSSFVFWLAAGKVNQA